MARASAGTTDLYVCCCREENFFLYTMVVLIFNIWRCQRPARSSKREREERKAKEEKRGGGGRGGKAAAREGEIGDPHSSSSSSSAQRKPCLVAIWPMLLTCLPRPQWPDQMRRCALHARPGWQLLVELARSSTPFWIRAIVVVRWTIRQQQAVFRLQPNKEPNEPPTRNTANCADAEGKRTTQTKNRRKNEQAGGRAPLIYTCPQLALLPGAQFSRSSKNSSTPDMWNARFQPHTGPARFFTATRVQPGSTEETARLLGKAGSGILYVIFVHGNHLTAWIVPR